MIVKETDVLVIGGGGAGAMAALKASDGRARVLMVIKGKFGKCGSTPMAMGAASAVGSWHHPDDNKEIHFRDTVKGGGYLNDQNLVRILVEEAPDRVLELERFGAIWERTDDGRSYLLRIGGGHSHPRSVYLEDRPGSEMLKAMKGELIRRNVEVLEDLMVIRILTDQDQVAGALALGTHTAEPVLIKARAIVLATGGAGQIYEYATQDIRNTGDGYALSLQAGANLVDMEFVQFFPIGLIFPESCKGLIVGAMYYSHLLDRNKERFMKRYDAERMELSTRDIVSRAAYTEIKEGRGTPRGGVWCDMTFNPPGYVKKQLPLVFTFCDRLGMNVEEKMLEIAPTCHFFMGGVRVDDHWASTYPGIYAAGEAAGGVHGANRLSQNSLADILVSGARAGKCSAEYASGTEMKKIDSLEVKRETEKIQRIFDSTPENGISPWKLKHKIKKVMWNEVSLFRAASGLGCALEEMEKMKREDLPRLSLSTKTKRFNRELIEALEVENFLMVSESIIRSAILREESRGAHYRTDCPELDNVNWLKHIAVGFREGEFHLSSEPVDLSEIEPEEDE